jgi:hypothetical protein
MNGPRALARRRKQIINGRLSPLWMLVNSAWQKWTKREVSPGVYRWEMG